MRSIWHFVMDGSMDNVRSKMKTIFSRSSPLEERRVFGLRKISKTQRGCRRRVESCRQVLLKSKEQKKTVDGRLHMTPKQQWQFLRIFWRKCERIRRHWLFTTLSRSSLFAICLQLQTAKKPETRAKRFDKLLEMLINGQKPT